MIRAALGRALPRVLPLALPLALALGLSGCGAGQVSVPAAPGMQPAKPCGTLRIAVNPWAGYDANTAVISYLARTELGCTVKLVKASEADSWKQLASGQVDVILENWGHDDLKRQYIDTEKVAVEAGLTGNTGVIGWYLPPWMAKAYPGITTLEGLRRNASLFRTPESGGKGAFYGGDPTFVTNDQALIDNLDLNLKLTYLGSEDKLIAAFRKAERTRTPMLGYFYSPQWLMSEVPLVHVNLPAYTPGCDADLKRVACDYQPFDLDKIASRKFITSGSPAVALITNFSWTNADQNQVARDLTEGELSPDAAAKKWLDAHPAVWPKWIQ